MARRYPGSLVARVLVNRYYALRKRFGKPDRQPGRLQTWFFQWEGLLIGGVFVGGLGIGAVKVYLNERLDDLGRRAERCKLYDGSCMMAASHLDSIQSSLSLYKALVDIAAQRREWQQQYQLLHQQRTQLAAQQVTLWQDRAVRWTGRPLMLPLATPTPTAPPPAAAATTAVSPAAAQGVQPPAQSQLQGQSQQQQQGAQEQGVGQEEQDGSSGQLEQQQRQQQEQQAADQHDAPTAVSNQVRGQQDRQAGIEQQQQQHSDHHQQQSSLAPQQHHQPPAAATAADVQNHNNQQQQQGEQRQVIEQQEQQHHNQQQLQQQQQLPPSVWCHPVRAYCLTRWQQAQRWLAEEQAALDLADRGAQLWLQLGRRAQRQIDKLQQQEQQQLLTLLSHTAQRAAWQALSTHTAEFELWLDVPSLRSMVSGLFDSLKAAGWLPTATTTTEVIAGGDGHDATATEAAATAAAAGDQVQSAAAAASQSPAAGAQGWMQRLQSGTARLLRRRRHQAYGQGDDATNSNATSSSSTAAVETSSSGSSTVPSVQRVRIRLLLPKWIPAALEERDFDLLCHDFMKTATHQQQEQPEGPAEGQQQQEGELPGQREAGQQTGQHIPNQQTEAAGGTSGASMAAAGGVDEAGGGGEQQEEEEQEEEIELDGGGVLVEVFEEALDVVQTLWEAAE